MKLELETVSLTNQYIQIRVEKKRKLFFLFYNY